MEPLMTKELRLRQMEPGDRKNTVSYTHLDVYKRQRQTAEAICHVCHAPLIIDQRLIEIDGGAFQGKRYEELAVLFPERYQAWVCLLYTSPCPISLKKLLTNTPP